MKEGGGATMIFCGNSECRKMVSDIKSISPGARCFFVDIGVIVEIFSYLHCLHE